ncbi:hypothetical protein M422DRAFT_271383 [Sphaerobolus stellatus SS14]|uniref:Nephrocystin 3-like N-terminal domain-containing protein n=1 Tax=Sphaerobolus stellatus (strain SS14) TaxID=990650 RepID=A0A0C9UEN8_SPHS4|nr:hypothetical protein M422DRAFT_271383 [Sphaerobolus stellatus SS14]
MSADNRLIKIRDGIQEGLLIGLDVADGIADAFPGPAKGIFGGIKVVVDLVDQFSRNKEDWKALKTKLQDITDTVAKALFGYDPDTVPKSLVENIQTMNKVLDGIQIEVEKAQQRKGWERALLLKQDKKVIQDLVGRLNDAITRLNFQEHIGHSLSLGQMELSLRQLNSKQEFTWLRETLSTPTQITLGDSCLEGTREILLSRIFTWVNDPAATNILWLSASPGAGKTAVVSTIVRKTGASRYFFRHTGSASQNLLWFWRTVAGSLLNQYAILRPYLSDAVKEIHEQQQSVEDLDLLSQFKKLIKSPLEAYYRQISQFDGSKPQIISLIVDALDEADRRDTRQWNELLETLAEWRQLPGIFRLIITSRPNDDIRSHLGSKFVEETLATGSSVSEESQADIDKYLRYRFLSIRKKIQQIFPSWSDKDIIPQLVNNAAGLFMWAKAALDYIEGGGDLLKRLQDIQYSTSIGHTQPLDDLYMRILQGIYKNLEKDEQDLLQKVLWTIIMAKQPMDRLSIEELINAPICSLWWVEQALRPVLAEQNNDHLLQSCHKSFTDFMLEQERSGEFGVKEELHGLYLADTCLQSMNTKLKFNILGLSRGYFNRDIVDLTEQVSVSIPQSLQHACKYWSEYYPVRNLTVQSKNSIQNLEIFLQKHFFHWLEVLSILSAGYYATSLLKTANKWLGNLSSNMVQLLTDGTKITDLFHQAIQESCSGLYFSILTFSPQTSLLANHYRKLYNPSLQVTGGIQDWPAECQVFLGHQDLISSVAFSSDGTKILSASIDKTVRIWDTSTGQTLGQPLHHQSSVISSAFSPDGTKIVSASGNKIQMWDISTGEALGQPFEGHQDRVLSVAFTYDGTKIISGSKDKTIRVWDTFTSQNLGSLEGHQDRVNSIAISPDGTKIVSGSDDRTVRIWDAFTSQSLGSLEGHQDKVMSIAISPDGTKIVSGSDDTTVRIWDVSTGNLEHILEGYQLQVISVAFSPDGTKIISGSFDRTIQVWEATTGYNLWKSSMGHQGSIFSVTFSPDGTKIASGSADRTVRVWDASAGDHPSKQLEYNQVMVISVTFSPDGMKIVSSLDSSIQVWDAYTGQKLGQSLYGHHWLVTSVALSPDGKKIVSGSLDMMVKVWEESDGWSLKLSLEGHKNTVFSVAFSPDGTKIVSGSADKTVQIWNASTGQSLTQPLEGHQNFVYSVAFSNDGTKIVSGSSDSIVRVWDAFTGQVLGSLEGHQDEVNSIAISPDGTKIASGSDDKTVIIWDTSTGQGLGQPFHHQDWVTSVAFSPDGTKIVSGSAEGVVYIWEISTGQSLGDPLEGHQGYVASAVFSPDGTKIVSSSYDGTIRVWKLTGQNIEQSLEGHQVPITTWTWDAKSGWILDTFSKAPIAWVPNNLWAGFHTPSTQLVIGASETVLDFSNYIPWEEWEV